MSAAPTPDASAAPKKSKKKLIVIILAGILLAGGSAAGAFWYATNSRHGAAAEDIEPAPKAPTKTYFTNLDPFTVNLQDPRGERFAQIGVTLEIDDPKTEVEIKDRLPAIRNNILMLVSSKQIEDLLTPEGKQHLALEIRDQAGRALGMPPDPPPPLVTAASEAGGLAANVPPPAASAHAPAKHAKNAKNERPHPIRSVLFSQFIVQ